MMNQPFSIDELREMCRERGIIPMPTSTRDELIQLLEEYDEPPDDDVAEELANWRPDSPEEETVPETHLAEEAESDGEEKTQIDNNTGWQPPSDLPKKAPHQVCDGNRPLYRFYIGTSRSLFKWVPCWRCDRALTSPNDNGIDMTSAYRCKPGCEFVLCSDC